MRRKLIAFTSAAVLSLVMVAVAPAKVSKFNGKFPNDVDARVSLGLKLSKNGKPTKAVNIEYSQVDYACEDGETGELSGSMPDDKVRDSEAYGMPPGKLVFSGNDNDPSVDPPLPAGDPRNPSASIVATIESKRKVTGEFYGLLGSLCGTGYDPEAPSNGAINAIKFIAKK